MKADDARRMPPPLSPATLALLSHERVPPAQPEMVRARALARARASQREFPTTLPRAEAIRTRRLLIAAAAGITLLAGVAAAFQMIRREVPHSPGLKAPQPPRSKSTVAPRAEPESASTDSRETSPVPTAVAAPAAPASTPLPGRRPAFAGRRSDELRILHRARQSDARGDYFSVLALVAQHERAHPDGRLTEEREVLRVRALVGLGRGKAARFAATRFRRQFPRSVLLPMIDDMLASLP
jgi:hypothetical protein